MGALEGAARASADEAPWRELKTPRFTVLSQMDDRATRAWASDFSQFVAGIHQVIQVNEQTLSPLTVVLFGTGKDFARFGPRMPSDVGLAGYITIRPSWATIGINPDFGAEHKTVYHTAVQWYLGSKMLHQPYAMATGLTELFSNFKVINGRESFTGFNAANVVLLRESSMDFIPVRELLAVRNLRELKTARQITLFNAESWALVHFLYAGSGSEGRGQLDRLLANFGAGKSTEAALAAIGMDGDLLTRRLKAYVRAGQFQLKSFPADPAAAIDQPIAPAAPGEVEVGLARAGYSNHPAVAESYAQMAVNDAPTAVAGYEILALIEATGRKTASAVIIAERAIQLGSQDGDVWIVEASHRELVLHDWAGTVEACDRAIAAGFPQINAFLYRGFANEVLNRWPEALEDFSAAIRADPSSSLGFFGRAPLRQGSGDDEGALADYGKGMELNPGAAWEYALKRNLLLKRMGRGTLEVPAEPAAPVGHRPRDAWNEQLAQFERGKISAEKLLAAADRAPEKAQKSQRVDAFYFIGMEQLIHGDARSAAASFQRGLDEHALLTDTPVLCQGELNRLRKAGATGHAEPGPAPAPL